MLFSSRRQRGSPSRSSVFALKVQPILITLLGTQAILAIMRFVLADMYGGLVMMMVTLLGTLAFSARGDGIDPHCACLYGLIVFIQALGDTAQVSARWVRLQALHLPILSTKLPPVHNIITVVAICVPVVEFTTA